MAVRKWLAVVACHGSFTAMTQDTAALYSALISRDPRFDGVFYVGVT